MLWHLQSVSASTSASSGAASKVVWTLNQLPVKKSRDRAVARYVSVESSAEVTVAVAANLTLESGSITIAVVFDTATLTGGRIGVLHVLKGTEVIRGDVSVGETKVYESEEEFLKYAMEIGKLTLK